MKKALLVALAVILACGLIFGGCAKPAPAPAPAPGPRPAEVIELKFATVLPPFTTAVQNWQAWANKIEELTGGKIKIVIYAAESLVPVFDQYPALIDGVCDIVMIHCWDVPELALERVYDLPMLGWTSENCLDIRKEAEKEFPQLAAGRSNVKTLWLENTPIDVIHLTEKEVRVPDDIKGMNLSANAPSHGLIQSCGAAAMGLTPPDWYLSLEKGVVEGIFMSYSVVGAHKLDEVTKFHLNVPMATSAAVVIMNQDKWNSLPADLQQIIDGTLAEQEKGFHDSSLKDEEETYNRLIAAGDHTVIEPTADELAKWQEKSLGTHQVWIDEMEAKGHPAQAAYDKLIEVIGRYK